MQEWIFISCLFLHNYFLKQTPIKIEIVEEKKIILKEEAGRHFYITFDNHRISLMLIFLE